MGFATVLMASALALIACAAAGGQTPPLACNLDAISVADRPRYTDLMRRLRAALSDPTELSDGFVFKLDTAKLSLPEVAEWIAMERLCCPFLDFNLEVQANGQARLTLRGPAGAKDILREEFPASRS